MISAIQWIRQGVAARHPEKYELDDEEYDRINKLAADQLDDAKEELKEAESMAIDQTDSTTSDKIKTDEEEALAIYNLDTYDEEVEASKDKKIGVFSKINNLTVYEDEDDDPYIVMKDNKDEEEEKAELEILPTDNLLLSAKTEDNIPQLEIYVFESDQDNLYVHHDILLPAFPLCLEWLDFHCGKKLGQESSGNYVAIGTFEPDIEIWNLDTVDAMYPEAILGHSDKTKKRSKKVNNNYHVDAIMDISWNKNHRNFLLSSSADSTIKLWDLSTSKCVQSYTHHSDKVQSVTWHPTEPTVFISGSYDKTVCVLDARSPNQVTTWKLDSDVESIRWDPHQPNNFYVALENGYIHYYDVRNADGNKGGKPLYILQAHDGAVSALDINPLVPGCIATGGTDKLIKVWNTADNRPSMVTSRNFDLGRIFCTQFCPDAAFQLAVAGSNGKLHIWDISSNAGVRQSFKHVQALSGPAPAVEKAPITILDDGEPESDNDESNNIGHDEDDEDEDDDDMDDV